MKSTIDLVIEPHKNRMKNRHDKQANKILEMLTSGIKPWDNRRNPYVYPENERVAQVLSEFYMLSCRAFEDGLKAGKDLNKNKLTNKHLTQDEAFLFVMGLLKNSREELRDNN